MEHVPDDLYDKEYDKRYNPMAKKATAGPVAQARGAWYHRPWATLIGIIETDSFFSFTHFENPEGEKERTHEFHTRELATHL